MTNVYLMNEYLFGWCWCEYRHCSSSLVYVNVCILARGDEFEGVVYENHMNARPHLSSQKSIIQCYIQYKATYIEKKCILMPETALNAISVIGSHLSIAYSLSDCYGDSCQCERYMKRTMASLWLSLVYVGPKFFLGGVRARKPFPTWNNWIMSWRKEVDISLHDIKPPGN